MANENDAHDSNTSREAAVTLMETVVNRWDAMGQPDEPLAEVILSVGIDLHVHGMGPGATSKLLRDLADTIETEGN